MLSFSGSLKVFVALEACDMRKGFNGLHAAVTERLGEDPRQGALFVFSNRRHTRIKILCWDGTGLWVLTNKHAPHCSLWFIKTALSISSPVRDFTGSVWCRWRRAGSGVCKAPEQYNPRHSGLDVRRSCLRLRPHRRAAND
jgi:IS66 Orf2 like protein